jgi:hypothetical protein
LKYSLSCIVPNTLHSWWTNAASNFHSLQEMNFVVLVPDSR